MSGYLADGLCRHCGKKTRHLKYKKFGLGHHLRFCNDLCRNRYYFNLRCEEVNKKSPEQLIKEIMSRPINDGNRELYEVIHEQSRIIMQLKEKLKKIEEFVANATHTNNL